MGREAGASFGLQPRDYTVLPVKSSFKIDEGYSDETKSVRENESVQDSLELPAWILARREADRAELAYTLLLAPNGLLVMLIIDLILVENILLLQVIQKVKNIVLTVIARIFGVDNHIFRSALNRTNFRCVHVAQESRNRHSESESGQPQLKRRALACDRAGAGPPEVVVSKMPTDTEGDHEMHDAATVEPNSPMEISSPTRLAARLAEKCNVPHSLDPSMHSPGFDSLFTDDRSPLPYSSAAVWSRNGPTLNWAYLYKQRQKLEENWRHGRFTNFQLPHPDAPWESHRERVYVIQFAGKWLVSGSRDKTVRVWDLESLRLRGQPLVGHTKSVLCLQFDASPEEDVIMSGSGDRSVIIWRFSTGEKIHELPNAHLDSVLNLRFDKRYLVTCSKDRTIKIFNRNALLPTDADYPRVAKGTGPRYPDYIIDTAAIPPSTLEAQMANQQIKPLAPYSLLITLDGHRAAVNAIQIDKDEIVSGSGDRLIKVWSIHSGTCLKTILGHNKGIACIQFDNQRIVSGSNDDTVRIYDHTSGAEVACLKGHSGLVRTVQAGFGDPPGSEETMRLEALAVDQEYFEARRRRHGVWRQKYPLEEVEATGPESSLAPMMNQSSSGMRDKEGKWIIGQRLNQAEAIRAARAAAAAAAARTQANDLNPTNEIPAGWSCINGNHARPSPCKQPGNRSSRLRRLRRPQPSSPASAAD
ncbi:F-box and WD domain-containing protein [Trichophyton equinum CBS 127.97]|uniref:F-box and WD domain-containing protein n=1 Tax=Trichophyton equinum (strain ATCC MYA-4606 / CBS 127.97) TaxID=559882 RepID=F2PSL2_TRIEC|nr:F-box and WD domain-containing protein [Trichophyton equinum CBS 127.97]